MADDYQVKYEKLSELLIKAEKRVKKYKQQIKELEEKKQEHEFEALRSSIKDNNFTASNVSDILNAMKEKGLSVEDLVNSIRNGK